MGQEESVRGYSIQQDECGDKDRLDISTLATHENHLEKFFFFFLILISGLHSQRFIWFGVSKPNT